METPDIELTAGQMRAISSYRRMGIDIDIIDADTVKVTQSRLTNGYILNQKQLHERAREVFPSAKIIPSVYSVGVDAVDMDWVSARMAEFGIKRNDLIKQLAIDKSTLSSMFSGDRGLTKSQRVAFYFYFLVYELNRDFRKVDRLDEPEAIQREIGATEALERYRNTDREYASTLLTAIMAIGEDEVLAKLEEAEKQGKRLQLTYPINPDIGPSEPNGVVII